MEKSEYMIMHDVEKTHWWFAGRRYLVQKILEPTLRKGISTSILDIGCGTGMMVETLERYGSVCGLDVSKEALDFAKKNGMQRLICTDANVGIPFKDHSFSVVTCLDVLEHLDQDHRALGEVFRVCKPGGLVIITVPAFDVHWSPHDVAVHHKRRYTRSLLYEKIAGLPWDVLTSSYYNTTLFFPILAVRKLRALLAGGHHETPKSDFVIAMPGFLNTFLAKILQVEIVWLNRASLPFGVSLVMVLKKRG